MASDQASVRVIGLGNGFRGDDAIGLEVARAIQQRVRAADVVIGVSSGMMLPSLWASVPLCFVIDCAVSGRRPGTIHVFDGLKDPIPHHFFGSLSTHAFSISWAIELGRTLGLLPQQLQVYGIEGGGFACGAQIAEPVRRAGEQVVGRVMAQIQAHRRRRTHGRAC